MKILTNSFFINFEKSANILDQKIPWSYAGLDDLSGQNLYWSQSRVYNANIEQWMTADPLVKWQARELSARPGNYYPYRYAGNDPLMMVDVSGHYTRVTLYHGESGNPFGHIGIGIGTEKTVGFGPANSLGPIDLIKNNPVEGRIHSDSNIEENHLDLKTTESQEKAMQYRLDFLKKTQREYKVLSQNCATTVADVLRAGGVESKNNILPAFLLKDLQQKEKMKNEENIPN